MALLQEVSKPGSDIEEYVKGLNAILEHKLEIISVLRSRLLGFSYHLKQEEEISKKFYDQQTSVDIAAPGPPLTDADTDLLADGVNFDDLPLQDSSNNQ